MFNFLILLPIFVTQGYAVNGIPDTHVEHERLHFPDHGQWLQDVRADGKEQIKFQIGLTQQNLNVGHDLLMDISDPTSENYGKHYTQDEVERIFAPSPESIDTVMTWLESSGISKNHILVSENKQWIQLSANISKLESLLFAKYHRYRHVNTGKTALACQSYHLPRTVASYIDYVKPGIFLATPTKLGETPQPQKRARYSDVCSVDGACDENLSVSPEEIQNSHSCQTHLVTPECIKQLYKVDDRLKRYQGNSIGIFEYGSFYSQEALNNYFQKFTPQIPKGTHPIFKGIDGAPRPSTHRPIFDEANLDIQTAYALAYPDEIVNFQVDDDYYETHVGNYLFNNFLDALDGSYCHYEAFGIKGNSPKDPKYPDKHEHGYKGKLQCGKYKPTKVLSISFSVAESALPSNYQRRQCNEWLKLGMQGVSVLVASGDYGVSTGYGANPGLAGCLGTSQYKMFAPRAPQGCPYVTTVGGTKFVDDPKISEVATTSFASSGGFSNVFPRPKYQNQAVSTYFGKQNPPYRYFKTMYNPKLKNITDGRYNRIGRAFPDVSAIGQNWAGAGAKNKTLRYEGTSASAPIVASLISRINNHRLAAGKSTLGFLNPSFYANPEMFNDILTGNNPGCGTEGFECSPGWDPVTGLGTPKYDRMLQYYMSLP